MYKGFPQMYRDRKQIPTYMEMLAFWRFDVTDRIFILFQNPTDANFAGGL